MNRNFKAIGAAVLTAVMCVSLTGCANNANNEKPSKLNESNIESRIESNFNVNSNNQSSSTPDEISEPKEVKLEPTDEIKNAKLNSGLVQYNNDIFQRGGYITAADFVEKYKDSYDISYSCPIDYLIKNAGSYDECKDYLLEYHDNFIGGAYNHFGMRWGKRESGLGVYKGCLYYLTLTPKNNSYGHSVKAYVVNATSPDEKITLDKAIVIEIESEYSDYKYITPEWYPLGLNTSDFKDKYDSENKSYTLKKLCGALEAKGLTKNSKFEQTGNLLPEFSKEENYNTYWKQGNDGIRCYIVGEQNLFGAKPLYYYNFTIDSNTDKVSYAQCFLEFFIKD